MSFNLYFVSEVEGTLTRETGTSNSELALDPQLPLGISQSFSAPSSDSQERDSRNEGKFCAYSDDLVYKIGSFTY